MNMSYRDMLVKRKVLNSLFRVDDNGVSCIYFLFDKDEVVYIGQSTSFTSRLSGHLSTDKVFDSYSVFSVEHAKMHILEAFLIMFYRPKYNVSEHLGRVSIPVQIQDILDVLLENFEGRERIINDNKVKAK